MPVSITTNPLLTAEEQADEWDQAYGPYWSAAGRGKDCIT